MLKVNMHPVKMSQVAVILTFLMHLVPQKSDVSVFTPTYYLNISLFSLEKEQLQVERKPFRVIETE